ncbi:hypothetical protein MKZ38_006449 [Zalerion maritima]|uniref:DUF1746 domain-containing protein n=1 Tax=Zalerion maritima TaxID=339359 RepID=A0AAD5RVG7_9PEZI|nr:hypothetical protein MKZ38_006449 [Zalerion maritima]
MDDRDGSSSPRSQQSATVAADTDDEPRRAATPDGGTQRKLKLIEHLSSNIDMMIFAELSALYYMEYALCRPSQNILAVPKTSRHCSFFRLLIRAIAQWMLNPTPIENLMRMPPNSAYIFVVVIPNAVCMLLHLFSSLPQPAPASRGYVHGGIIVDFVGQKPPSSCIPLLFIDIFILILQFAAMSIQIEREGISQSANPTELASNPPRSEVDDQVLEEGRSRLPNNPPPSQDLSQLEETLRSGTSLLAEVDILGCLRRVYNLAPDERMLSGAYSFQNLGYSRTLGALAAERRRQAQQTTQQPLPPGG